VALTIVATVGLGLGLVAVVFTLLNAFIFRVDEVRNPHELFAVERQRSANAETEGFTRPQYDALVRETGVFSDAFAMTPDIDRWIDGQRMEGPHGRAPGDACRGADRVGRASLRSGRLRRQPALHRHGVRMCGAGSRAARRADRSDRRAQAGVIR
jgi:hypothetical protein